MSKLAEVLSTDEMSKFLREISKMKPKNLEYYSFCIDKLKLIFETSRKSIKPFSNVIILKWLQHRYQNIYEMVLSYQAMLFLNQELFHYDRENGINLGVFEDKTFGLNIPESIKNIEQALASIAALSESIKHMENFDTLIQIDPFIVDFPLSK